MHFSLLPIELYLTVEIFDSQPLAHHTKARSFMPTRCLMEKAESLQMLVVISMKCREEKNGCRRLQILQIHYTIPALPIPTCQQHSLSYTYFLFLYLLPILQKHRGRHVVLLRKKEKLLFHVASFVCFGDDPKTTLQRQDESRQDRRSSSPE
ncbi:hypothetical protein BofuT4_P142270.1 [Botrytis cinerea T4]|uniref:Uncharacterized protein n=1 Tax=Botryotinia fuckeliana (strain T4) TaxID=999810 RepID=G2YZB7_BOTF4|nr:hypothetical protein BofuT4_P142270.1 [Botrytis cinerea T4]